MATWRAKCWLGSSAGYQDLEVQANTLNGAKEQLHRIYGAEQISNLREVSGGGSSLSSGDSSGILWLAGVGFILYILVTYWYIAVPIIALLIALYIYGSSD
jgi:hypothetical protein